MMSVSQAQRDAAYRIAHDIPDIDSTLPVWAQRKNPIIMRMLGAHWRVFFPEFRPLLKAYAVQVPLVLLTIQFPWLYILVLTFLMPAVVALPFIFYVYLRTIVSTIGYSTTGMAEEFEHDTLRILRSTPFTTREIILSKTSASVWRQADEIDQLLSYVVMMGMPIIMALYLAAWPPDEYAHVNQFMTLVTFASTMIRIPIEIYMIAALGTAAGAAIHSRSMAFLWTATLVFFYFLLTNLVRLVDMSWTLQLFVDAALPVILPFVIIYGAIRFAVHQIESD